MEFILMLLSFAGLFFLINPLIKKVKENYNYIIKRNKLIILYLEKKLNVDSDFIDID